MSAAVSVSNTITCRHLPLRRLQSECIARCNASKACGKPGLVAATLVASSICFSRLRIVLSARPRSRPSTIPGTKKSVAAGCVLPDVNGTIRIRMISMGMSLFAARIGISVTHRMICRRTSGRYVDIDGETSTQKTRSTYALKGEWDDKVVPWFSTLHCSRRRGLSRTQPRTIHRLLLRGGRRSCPMHLRLHSTGQCPVRTGAGVVMRA